MDSSVQARRDTGSVARLRAQVHSSSIAMDWLMTCSKSAVFLMRISPSMRSWRNRMAPTRTISRRARNAAVTMRCEECRREWR